MKNKKTKYVWSALLLLGGVWGMVVPQQAQAVPAFARQTGMTCLSCHYQHYPTLNAFGRAFKSSGYTMRGAQSLIEGDDLSTTSNLNISLVSKLRYQKSNGSDPDAAPTNRGEIQWPDEAALLIGGRVGEKIGFMLEHATFGAANSGSGDVTITACSNPSDPTTCSGTADTGDGSFTLFNSYKIHFNVAQLDSTQLSTVLFSTDAGGVSYGFELMNTGAQRFMRPIEERSVMGAAQYLGLGSGEATGVALVATNPGYFVNYSLWLPRFGNIEGAKFASYLRAALTPNIAGWDTGFGIQYFSGEYGFSEGSVETIEKTEAWVVDGQAQGSLGDMPIGVYASYGNAPADATNHFNSGADDKSALAGAVEVGILPNKAQLYVAGRKAKTSADKNDYALTLGGSWMLQQNVKLELFHTMKRGAANPSTADAGDAITTLMIFAGF